MPAGRQLEGAAGPADGLGGKWVRWCSVSPRPVPGVTVRHRGQRDPLSAA